MSSGETIVVVGSDASARVAVARVLESAGFEDVEVRASIALDDDQAMPDAMIITGDGASVLCAEAREVPLLADVPVVVVVPSVPADAAAGAIAAGADEIVVAPPSSAVLGNRVRTIIRCAVQRRQEKDLVSMQRAMTHVQDLISAGGDAPDTMREVLLRVVDTLGFERASLIAHIESSEHAYVVAATDDPSYRNFALAIVDYPELAEAMRREEPVLIGDALSDPLTENVVEKLRDKNVRSIVVFPILWRNQSLGALLFRSSKPGLANLDSNQISFAGTFANTVAGHLRHGTVIERLRDQTRRISRASYEAERRLRTIETLKEHFEASADGVVVLDDEGHILFLNGTAEAITGFARDGLVGSPLFELVPVSQRDPLREVVRGVLSGKNLEAFDSTVLTTSGQPICVSVTTSTVLSKSGSVILSFRDVTEQRILEGELQQTKDFLENLIDSAVDAIVAADMRGHVLLFNPGAERLFGYTRDEVIGQIPIWTLFPEDCAVSDMQMLRESGHGGIGRLEQTRREVLASSGELIPVHMTSSIIYDDGHEVATVAILSDLRDRLRMEDRLVAAQERLEAQERQAMVAQLAGATAHELNQPLTSIMAYAELVLRKLPADSPTEAPVQVILRQAERMADIVKKIGRITRYETKAYVGSASIIDLDKSAATSGELPQMDESALDDLELAEEDGFDMFDDAGEGEGEGKGVGGFEEEATQQFDALVKSDEVSRSYGGGLPVAVDDEEEERTHPSLRVGAYTASGTEKNTKVERGLRDRNRPAETDKDAPDKPPGGQNSAGSDSR